MHALTLDSQHHHRVDARFQRFVQVVADLARPVLDADRQQCGWRNQRDLCTQRAQQPDVGPRHPGMQDISDDRHTHPSKVRPGGLRPVELGPVAAHRERIQQRLRGVFVGAIACVDHCGVDPVRGSKPVRSAGSPMADDHRIRAHGGQRLRSVFEGLTLGNRGAFGCEVDDIGLKPLCCSFEGDPGTGGVLEEEVHYRAATEGRELLDLAVAHGRHFFGSVQDADGVESAEVLSGEEVLHCPASITTSLTGTPSTESISSRWTRTFSAEEVGRFLPTWSARMGSSRCPLSTRTARRTILGRPRSTKASSAALMVRPEYRTSSMRTTTLLSMPDSGKRVWWGGLVGWCERSSRNMVTSSCPTIVSALTLGSAAAILLASRTANG